MSSVLTQFQLNEVKRVPYNTIGEDGKVAQVEATGIQLSAVKGDPFGPATPQGALQALIVNPAAAKVFQDASIGTVFQVQITPVGEV